MKLSEKLSGGSMNKPILLGVNIDHVATVRQARKGPRYPDPVQAAMEAEQAGAAGITVHLREDRRHIQERDITLLKAVLQTRMNLEMAATDKMVAYAEQLQPEHCCLVPEKREEVTTEGGLDIVSQRSKIQEVCERLAAIGIEVSLFIDPDVAQIDAAKACGAPAIELHTGCYANTADDKNRQIELQRLQYAAEYAAGLGLIVNAGHGLDYHNVTAIAAISVINELNIGYAIIARALFTGLQTAVRDMKELMEKARFNR